MNSIIKKIKNILKNIILRTIEMEARAILRVHKPLIIGVTGNIGKTSTKDNIVHALHGFTINGRGVRGNKKSLNSEFGVPLTIIGQDSGWNSISKWVLIILRGALEIFNKSYPRVLILEIGADRVGDIKSIMKWIKLDIGVITQFAQVPVHIENFKNREEMIKEKSYLAAGIRSGGLLIYNSDCADSCRMSESAKDSVERISFGKKSGDCRASLIISDIKDRAVHAKVLYQGKNYNMACAGVLGDASVLCALPAIVISKYLECDKKGNVVLDFKKSLENIRSMPRAAGRMKLLDGKVGSIIIDDSYNSSPLALAHGLKTLGEVSATGRKVAILGDMLELGDMSREEHLRVGREVARVAHVLVTVGPGGRLIAEGAMSSGMDEGWVLECEDAERAGREVLAILKRGDILYIKGSQGMRMEKATKILLDTNASAKDSLPRQEDEWLKLN